MISAPARLARPVAWAGRTAARWAQALLAWMDRLLRELAEHPVRTVWTLVVSMALFSAVWPVVHDSRGWWLHAMHWGFLVNRQNDYGEGPLFNQQVIMYHLLFDHGNPLYRGQNIYQLGERPPFIVGNYPPVFQLVTALFMRVYGLTFTAGRLVSSLSIMGAAILIALIVWKGTGQILPGIFGGGVLITMNLGIWSWGPYNRVDSLALFWSMLTIFLVLRYAGTRKVWWAVPIAIFTLYTRQSMVDGVFAAFCYLVVRDWRRAIWVGLGTLAGILGVFVFLQVWTHGAFYLNTVVDNENAFNWNVTLTNWRSFISGEGSFAFPLAVAGAAAGLLGRGSVLWPVWLAGAVYVFATIGKTGAASNYFFTLEAATAACAGVFVGRLRTFFRHAPLPLWPLELVVPAMLFVYVHGTPPRWVPAHLPLAQRAMGLVGPYRLDLSAAGRNAGARVCPCWVEPPNEQAIAYFRTVQGPVMAIDFPDATAVQAGHQLQWQPFEAGADNSDGTWNPTPFLAAIRNRYYAAIYGAPARVAVYVGPVLGSQIVAAVESSYHPVSTPAGQVWLRNSPPTTPPPVVAQWVPHPLAEVGRALEHLPARLVEGIGARLSPPHPETIGSFTVLDIRPRLNLIGVENPRQPAADPVGWAASGDFLSTEEDFPPPGLFTVPVDGRSIPFSIPPSGSDTRSLLEIHGSVTIPLPPQRDSAVWLLEAAVYGSQQATVTFTYKDALPWTENVPFADWCSAPGPWETVAFRGTTRLDAQGRALPPACGMFGMRLTTNPDARLSSIRIAANDVEIG